MSGAPAPRSRGRVVPARAKVYVDGVISDGEDARVSVFDRGFLYGDSVYEVTRTVGGVPLFLQAHLQRLAASAAALAMTAPREAELRAAVEGTLAALGEARAYLRVVLSRGAGELGLDPACADEPLLVVIAKPLTLPEARLYDEGADLVSVPFRRDGWGGVPAEVKSGNYLPSVLAMAEVRRRGAYEAVLHDEAGRIREGASSNLFFLRGGVLRTPPLGMLHGVTRAAVLGLLGEQGVPWEEGDIDLGEAAGAAEAFLTSSVRGVMPVRSLDGRPLGGGRPGPLTRALMGWYGERIGEAAPTAATGAGAAAAGAAGRAPDEKARA